MSGENNVSGNRSTVVTGAVCRAAKAQVSYYRSPRHPAFGDPTCGAFIRTALILANISEDAN